MLANLQRSLRRLSGRHWLLLLATTGISLAADLWSKAWAWHTLRARLGQPVSVWDPYIEFDFAHNTGTAFSVFTNVNPWVFVPIGLGIIGYLLYFLHRLPAPSRLHIVGAGLIVSGAVGNLHDRIFRVDAAGNHGVVDFIRIHYPSGGPWGGSWPSFNIADAVLIAGVALMMLALSRQPDK